MSEYGSRKTRPESFSYVGRDGHGTLNIALSLVVIGLFVGAIASPSVNGTAELPPTEEKTRTVATVEAVEAVEAQPNEVPAALVNVPETITASVSGDETLIGAARPSDRLRNVKVQSGDTLMSVMLSAGINRGDAHEAVRALRSVYDPKDLRVGQQVRLTLSPEDSLEEIVLDPTVVRRVAVRRDSGDAFRAFETKKTLTRETRHARGRITSSLYKAAVKQSVPLPVLEDLMRIYSWGIDFQREIQPNDEFEITYERFVDEYGDFVRHGEVLYAVLMLSGDKRALYRFEIEPGIIDYFDGKGKSAKRALMRTPINGARLSSRFGKRRHPVLGYTKMHRGVDFAAASGTPIYAAGDGVVEYRGRNGGYGNYIRIRHAGRYATAYAHMKGFARGIKTGGRVRQGQVIGYVGSTGRSTGPHLHYEILANGRQVNPLAVKMASGRTLSTKAMARFQTERASIDRITAAVRKNTKLTQR